MNFNYHELKNIIIASIVFYRNVNKPNKQLKYYTVAFLIEINIYIFFIIYIYIYIYIYYPTIKSKLYLHVPIEVSNSMKSFTEKTQFIAHFMIYNNNI